AAIHQLAHDQPGLDGLTDADIVGDQQSHDGNPQRHQQWDKLIGAWLEAETCRRSKWSGAPPERKSQSFGEEACAVLGRQVVGRRKRETRGAQRLALERWMDQVSVRLGAPERAQAKRGLVRRGERHPFPPARIDEIARREDGGHALPPSRSTSSAGGFSPGTSGRTATV